MTTRIEAHGIDFIPDGERYGHPRSLFAVWAAANVSYLYIVLGGVLVLLGLNVWQALAVVAAGNAFWLLVGWLSVSGPASGTPGEVVTRALFGIRGNRAYNALAGWGVGVAYEAINLAVASLAALALARACGLRATTALPWATIGGTALIAATISPAGAAAMFAGTAAAALCVSTTVYRGPAAAALAGADLSALAGPALAAPVYYALARKQITHANPGNPGLPDGPLRAAGGRGAPGGGRPRGARALASPSHPAAGHSQPRK